MAEVEIPFELITGILTQLPVKSLCRFKCVSNAWKSSPFFIDHHFKSNPNPKIIVVSHHSLCSASIPDDHHNNNLHFTELNLPPTLPEGHVNLIESCNGILLITDFDKKTIFLSNPANNTYRLLPPIQGLYHAFFEFGYDSHTDNYKVITVFRNLGKSEEICVYSMRENVWKFLEDESAMVEKYSIRQTCGIGDNGMLYFVFVTREGKLVLSRLDVRTEAFSIVDYPELDCYDFSKLSMMFSKLSGCLCLVVNYYSEWGELMYADVWEMRESEKKVSWVKLFSIQNSEVVEFVGLVAYSKEKEKEKVLLEVDRALFGWYDLVTKSLKKVKTRGLWDVERRGVAMMYVESLVSVTNDKAVSVSVSEGGTSPN